MTLLGDDWRKLVLLQADRFIEFHGSSGLYYKTRIPKMGRDMTYDHSSCDLLVAASSTELYRLNLDRGQFMAPFQISDPNASVNSVRISDRSGLYGLACDNGLVEFWDRRDRSRLAAFQVGEAPSDVTALHFLPDGLHWAAGTGDGQVMMFDLRSSSKALLCCDHYNSFPIKKIDYHASADLLVSSDKRSIKFWKNQSSSYSSSTLFTTIEPENDINDFLIQPASGLVIVANEASPVSSYFVPALGPAPRWCSFLENLTEEMEEAALSKESTAVYDNFKFVTKSELAQLGLDHLLGTALLRPYMHGFFIDLRLYEKAKAIANPFAFEEHVQKQRQLKLDRDRQSRIHSDEPLAKKGVNRRLVEKLKEEQDEEVLIDNKKKKRSKEAAQALLKDPRFGDLFDNPDFEIDEKSTEFQMKHPTTISSDRKKK